MSLRLPLPPSETEWRLFVWKRRPFFLPCGPKQRGTLDTRAKSVVKRPFLRGASSARVKGSKKEPSRISMCVSARVSSWVLC